MTLYHIPMNQVPTFIQRNEFFLSKEISDCFPSVKSIKHINTQQSDIVLLLVDNKMAGIAFIRYPNNKDNTYYIHTVCIFKNYRGQGMCAPYISGIAKYYAKRGKVTLEVLYNNTIARKCYEKAGFINESIKMIYNE